MSGFLRFTKRLCVRKSRLNSQHPCQWSAQGRSLGCTCLTLFVHGRLCVCRETCLLHLFLADGGPNAGARNLEKQWGTVDRAPGRASPFGELQIKAGSAGMGTA